MLTKQQYFDQAINYIMQQETRCMADPLSASLYSNKCAYQNAEGNRCVIGNMIPDEHQALNYQGVVDGLVELFPDLRTTLLPEGGNWEMPGALQDLHDQAKYRDPETMGGLSERGAERAREIASQFGLTVDNLDLRPTPGGGKRELASTTV